MDGCQTAVAHDGPQVTLPSAQQAILLASSCNSVSPRRVLFFYQDFGAQGGIERYLQQTSQCLRERQNFEPIVVCCDQTPLYHALKSAGTTVYGLTSHSFFARSLWRTFDVCTLWRLLSIIRREKPDIIHVQIGLIEALVFRLLNLPVVYTFHGYGTLYSSRDAHSPLKKCVKVFVRFLFQQTAQRLDTLLFVSHAEQQRMSDEGYLPTLSQFQPVFSAESTFERLGHCAVSVLQNGVPLASLRQRASEVNPQALKASLGLPAQARCVSFINRLDHNKNPLQFVQLANTLHNIPGYEDIHFLLVGDGPLREAVDAAIYRTAAHPYVHALGYREDIPELLAITDLIIYPARREGFGLGLVEAMALGIPCVAYASEGASEILEDPLLSQCLVPVDDDVALLHTVQTLLSPSKTPVESKSLPTSFSHSLREALQRRANCFSQERFIEGLEAVYRQLCPLVSVILPVYQGEDIIARAIHSVLAQTYPHFELIVVDDGSTDGTWEQLQGIDDARVKCLSQANQGVATARNCAFQHAKGDYIAFVDADDYWLPHKLATEIETLRQQTSPDTPACLIYSAYYAVDDANHLIHCPPIRRHQGDLSTQVLEDEGVFLPSTALVHRSIYEALRGFKTDCYHEDRVFFIEACQRFPAYATGKRLVLYRQSLSGRCRSVLKSYEDALKAELSIVETLQGSLSTQCLNVLRQLQMRNLFYRFLMYGYLPHARRLYPELRHAPISPESAPVLGLFPADIDSSQEKETWDVTSLTVPKRVSLQGKKGLLAQLSLKTSINFLFGARLLVQEGFRVFVSPIWRVALRI